MLATAAAAPAADGDAILDRVRAAWTAERVPALVAYDVVVEAGTGTSVRRDRYHGEADPASGTFRVRPFSAAEERDPYVPRGTNVSYRISITLPSGNQPVTGGDGGIGVGAGGSIVREAPAEPFAIPELSPLYAFGLRGCAIARAPGPAAGTLPTIGSVTTVRRRYRATVAGTEAVDGAPALHLALAPLIDPQRDRLRDLWIDPATNLPLAARVAGNFTGRAERAVPWLIRFATVAGLTAIETEIAEAPVRRGRTVFDRVAVRFEHVTASSSAVSALALAIPLPAGLNAIEEPPDRGPGCAAGPGE